MTAPRWTIGWLRRLAPPARGVSIVDDIELINAMMGGLGPVLETR